MIVRLTKEQQAATRRQLLSDVVWVVTNDTLRRLMREGKTTLAPVEVYLSAREFSDTVLGLSDIDEGIDYEMDDLEDEAENENDVILILMLASAQMQAQSKRTPDIDIKSIILRIYERCSDHELFLPLLEQFAAKEEARWMADKRTNLLDYELQEIKLEGGNIEEVKNIFESFVNYSDQVDKDSIKGNLLVLNLYNIEHNHAYDEAIKALYAKIGLKSTLKSNDKDALIAKSDKDLKAAIEALIRSKDKDDEFVFKNKKQWWAVYRVLYYFCNYPSQMTTFVTKMKELDVAKIDGKRDLSYDSLSGAAKDVPFMVACSPATWNALKDKSDNYMQQYVVAEYLMQELGIKS